MKKNSRMFLLFFAGIYALSGTAFGQMAQEAVDESDYAPPLLSLGQAKELRDQFVFWLGKHYRCLYGGKCTRVEKAQVTAEWKRWIVRLGIGAVLAVGAYFAPKGAQKLRKEVVGLSADVTEAAVAAGTQAALSAIDRDLLAEATDVPTVSLSPEDRRDRIRLNVQKAVKSALGIPLDAQGGIAEEITEQILSRLETREFKLPGGLTAGFGKPIPVPTGASAGAGASSGTPPIIPRSLFRGPLEVIYGAQGQSGSGTELGAAPEPAERPKTFAETFGDDPYGVGQPSGAGAGQ